MDNSEENPQEIYESQETIETNKYIGSVIRDERQKLELTIEELSEILDIAPGFLGLIERGQRGTSLKNLFKIANIFNISMDKLTGFETEELESEFLDEYNIKFEQFTSFGKLLNLDELALFITYLKEYIKAKKLSILNQDAKL